MRPRISSTAGAGSVTTVLAVVLWLAVQAGTAGGESPFPISNWAGPSYGRDPHHGRPPAPPLSDAVSGDAARDRFVVHTFPREPDEDRPGRLPPLPPAQGSPTPTHEPSPAPSPSPTVSPTPSPSPSPTVTPDPSERYDMDVLISASRTSARPGDSIRYTIRVKNTGTDTLRNTNSETHVPQGTTRAACSGSGSFSVCSAVADSEEPGEHVQTWIGTLGPGETFTYTLDVIVSPSVQKGFKIKNHAHGYAPDTGRVTSRTVTVTVV